MTIEPEAGPCAPWLTTDQLEDCWTVPADASEALIAMAIDAASDLLFQRSARRFPGECTDTVIPVGACGGGMVAAMPNGSGGLSLAPIPSSHAHGGMCCAGGHRIELGAYPITAITEVRVDGVVLDPAAYRVDDWAVLVRLDGGMWPCCNNGTEDPPHLAVDFTFGQAPPGSGVLAAVALTRELVKATCPSGGPCALDQRVQSLSREGVTITIPGLVDTLREGRTGIPAVDLFLWSHNPNGLQRRGRILDLSGAGVHRRTFPLPGP